VFQSHFFILLHSFLAFISGDDLAHIFNNETSFGYFLHRSETPSLFACEEAFDFGIMPLLELTVGTIRSAWTVLKLALDIQNPIYTVLGTCSVTKSGSTAAHGRLFSRPVPDLAVHIDILFDTSEGDGWRLRRLQGFFLFGFLEFLPAPLIFLRCLLLVLLFFFFTVFVRPLPLAPSWGFVFFCPSFFYSPTPLSFWCV